MASAGPRLQTWYERLTVFRAVRTIVAIAILLVLAGGALARIVEPQTFKSLGISYWWALETVTTVGYGDVAPSNLSGRLVGALVMLEGVAFIAIVTAAITSTFVARATRHDRARTDEALSDRELIEKRFDELERKLDRLTR